LPRSRSCAVISIGTRSEKLIGASQFCAWSIADGALRHWLPLARLLARFFCNDTAEIKV
jgi:hypothetical protein